jgi:hypothetical protein
MTRLHHVLLLLLPWAVLDHLSGHAMAQIVNTQPLLAKGDAEGFSGELGANFEWRTGNVDLLRLSSSLLLLYRKSEHTLLSNSNIEYGEKSSERYLYRTFSHFRYQYRASEEVTWEAYAQIARDEFRRTKLRALVGIGPRLSFVDEKDARLTLGTAYMLEHERYSPDTSVADTELSRLNHRGSFYLDARLVPKEDITLLGTVYAQPNLLDWGDLLTHLELKCAVRLISKLALNMSFTLAWDTTPTELVESLDTTTLVGLSWTF